MADDDSWNDPYDNDDDNDTETDWEENNIVANIGFFEYDHSPQFEGQEYDGEEHMEFIMQDNRKYFIGTFVFSKDVALQNGEFVEFEPKLFHGISILAKTFFYFPIKEIITYLKYYTYDSEGSMGNGIIDRYPPNPPPFKIHILQLLLTPVRLNPCEYMATVILKTLWISLIQRHWRSVLKKRREILEKMKTSSFLYRREMSVKYRTTKIPGFIGLMSSYSSSKNNKIK